MANQRWTAASRFGMVGFGAGPGPGGAPMLTMANGGNNNNASATAEIPPEAPPGDVAAFSGRLMDDPTFWMVASIGAVIFLAAYSAGELGAR